MTISDKAKALDRLAAPAGGIYGVDYAYEPISLDQNQVPTFGVTVWNAEKLGPQPTDEQLEAEVANAPLPVPREIAHWRARAVLRLAGLIDAVETELGILQGNAGIVARAAWEGSSPLARNGPTVLMLAATLGLTDAQVDDMFRQAAALQV